MLQKTAILATNTIFRKIDFNLTTHCGVITTSFIKSSWQPIHLLSCQYKPVRSRTQLDLTLLPITAVTLRSTPKPYVPIRYCHTLTNTTQHRHCRTCLSFTAKPWRNLTQQDYPILPIHYRTVQTVTNLNYPLLPVRCPTKRTQHWRTIAYCYCRTSTELAITQPYTPVHTVTA